MFLQQINLKNFRNFTKASFIFNPFLTIIIGENAKGKTNLIEAIYFLINGQGFRESKEEELIGFKSDKMVVNGKFILKDNFFYFSVIASKSKLSTLKIFLINKVKKKHQQYSQEQTKAILFSPQQLEMITGNPDLRRDYFNKLISIYDFEYKKKLHNYENALRKRNKVFEHFRNEIELKEELVFWNQYLIQQGNYITLKRQEYVDFLNNNQKLDSKKFETEYLKNEITQDKLNQKFNEEKKWRRTLIGPQKDDFQIYLKNDVKKEIHHYGSRSEQRLAIFWLKINEIKYFEKNYNRKPIILLDDIFSELDFSNKKLVIDLIKKYQTIVTTTDIGLLELIDIPKSIIKL